MDAFAHLGQVMCHDFCYQVFDAILQDRCLAWIGSTADGIAASQQLNLPGVPSVVTWPRASWRKNLFEWLYEHNESVRNVCVFATAERAREAREINCPHAVFDYCDFTPLTAMVGFMTGSDGNVPALQQANSESAVTQTADTADIAETVTNAGDSLSGIETASDKLLNFEQQAIRVKI